jgi:ribonuclease H2 subunit C
MLAIQSSKHSQGKCTPNILPCRVQHNGPVNASKRFWNPEIEGIVHLSGLNQLAN